MSEIQLVVSELPAKLLMVDFRELVDSTHFPGKDCLAANGALERLQVFQALPQHLSTVRSKRIVIQILPSIHPGFTHPLIIALPMLRYELSKNSSIATSPPEPNAPSIRRLKLGVVSSLTYAIFSISVAAG
jgi:hypothetical protein